jgi:hypothetical protein
MNEPREGNARLGRHCASSVLLLPLWPFYIAKYWIRRAR